MKILLIFLMFASISFAETIKEIDAKIETIQSAPYKYAQDRVAELDKVIKSLPDRKAGEGRMTMREYLGWVKRGIEDDPGEFVLKEYSRLIKVKEQITIEKEVINDEKIITDIK